jgi:hypothetical protein
VTLALSFFFISLFELVAGLDSFQLYDTSRCQPGSRWHRDTAGMLAALPAHSVTHLTLHHLHGPANIAAVSAAIARLSNLQQLQLDSSVTSLNCQESLAQLTHLTLLERDRSFYDDDSATEELQLLLAQPLPLRVPPAVRIPYYMSTMALDMSHQKQLQQLSIGSSLEHAVFPLQLQQLEAGYLDDDKQIQPLLQLSQLQHLSLKVAGFDKPELLLSLAELPALQLALQYFNPESATAEKAVATAAAWPRLPQLREL